MKSLGQTRGRPKTNRTKQFMCAFFLPDSGRYASGVSRGRFGSELSGHPGRLGLISVYDSQTLSPPGNRAIFSRSWGGFLTKSRIKPGEKERRTTEDIQRENPRTCRYLAAAVLSESVLGQNGPNDHFGQNDQIPNQILAFAGPKWTKMLHFGAFWPEGAHFGPFRSANRTLAIPDYLSLVVVERVPILNHKVSASGKVNLQRSLGRDCLEHCPFLLWGVLSSKALSEPSWVLMDGGGEGCRGAEGYRAEGGNGLRTSQHFMTIQNDSE